MKMEKTLLKMSYCIWGLLLGPLLFFPVTAFAVAWMQKSGLWGLVSIGAIIWVCLIPTQAILLEIVDTRCDEMNRGEEVKKL